MAVNPHRTHSLTLAPNLFCLCELIWKKGEESALSNGSMNITLLEFQWRASRRHGPEAAESKHRMCVSCPIYPELWLHLFGLYLSGFILVE